MSFLMESKKTFTHPYKAILGFNVYYAEEESPIRQK